MMQIELNGETRETADNATIAQLLEELQLPPARVAVEVNYELVPRERHTQHVLEPGDRLEVVTLVGGG
ncbi:MAG: sulfur carrier protein ThiS [Pirellulaceae bacterium]